jgi:two-component system LytT family response regulator
MDRQREAVTARSPEAALSPTQPMETGPIRALLGGMEGLSLQRARSLLRRRAGWVLAGECDGAAAAMIAASRLAPDIVLLDVQLADRDGLALAASLQGLARPPLIVLIAADESFAVDAFDVHAVGYLVKPIDSARFETTVQRVERLLRATVLRGARTLATPMEARSNAPARHIDRLAIRSVGRVQFVEVARIQYVRGAGNYVEIHCDAKSFLYRERIHILERRLDPDRFVRIHRSTIVNRSSIAEIRPLSGGDYTVLLRNGGSLRLSRTYRPMLATMARSG